MFHKHSGIEISVKDVSLALFRGTTHSAFPYIEGIQERYAVRAKDDDGSNLTLFVKKDVFDKLSCPVAKN